jgi:NADH-ubiquinone oxidoreductase chain 1
MPRLRINFIISTAEYMLKLILCLPIAALWLISCVAETNRTPFDFAEGESELVSGFNIEYGSGGFAMIFIAEYARIYFISFLF